MDKENGEGSGGGDKNKNSGHSNSGPDPNSLLDAASLFGKHICFNTYI